MSFSSKTKAELCRNPIRKPCCARAEAFGVLLLAKVFTTDEIRITTESREFAARISPLFSYAFGFGPDRVIYPPEESRAKVMITIVDPNKIQMIFESLGLEYENSVSIGFNAAIIEDDCCRSAFLRGAFLAGGSITDPEKMYHLELVTSRFTLSKQISAFLLDNEIPAKTMLRKSNYVMYIKESSHIEDFLTLIGAPVASVSLVETKVEKDIRNRVNRKVNCETANLSKTVEAAAMQIGAIHLIEEKIGFDKLPDKLKEAAKLRMDNPELTLTELVEIAGGSMSRSGMNHRFRKIMEIAAEIENENKGE